MPSSPQTISTQVVFDYIYDTSGKAVVGAKVTSTLNLAGASDTSPIVNIGPLQQSATTDTNGYWQFNLIPNPALTPVGTSYTIETPYNSYSISVPNSAGPFQSSSIVVNVPVILSPAITGLTGPITITGNETVAGTLTVQGTTTLAGVNTGSIAASANSSISGDLTILSPGRLLFTATAAKIVPGATSLSHRNNADSADNLLIADSGLVTIRNGLTVSAGDTTLGGRLVMSPASAKIVGGATQLSLRNNADSADNLLIADAGTITLRNALSIPASSGGTLATSSYGSTTVKIAEQVGTGASGTITFSSIPAANYRKLIVDIWAQADNAINENQLRMFLHNDTTAVYDSQLRWGSGGSGAWSSSEVNGNTYLQVGFVPGTNSPANHVSHHRIEIGPANSTAADKAMTAQGGWNSGTYAAGHDNVTMAAGWWHNASPAIVDRIDLTMPAGNFKTTSIAILYGIP